MSFIISFLFMKTESATLPKFFSNLQQILLLMVVVIIMVVADKVVDKVVAKAVILAITMVKVADKALKSLETIIKHMLDLDLHAKYATK